MNPTVKYGLLSGLGVSGWMLMEYSLGFHTTRLTAGQYSGYFSHLIPLGMLFLLLRARQQAPLDRELPLVPSVAAGLAASLVAALVVCGFLLLYNQLLNPGWIDTALEWKVAQWRAQGASESAIREQILAFRHLNSPWGLLAGIPVKMTAMGGLFTLGLALALRRYARTQTSVVG